MRYCNHEYDKNHRCIHCGHMEPAPCHDCGKDGNYRYENGLPLAFPYCDMCFDNMVRECRSRSW
jgi:hypothetical protein